MDSDPLKDKFDQFFNYRIKQSRQINLPLPLVCSRKFDKVDMLAWLGNQPEYPKIYWQNRHKSLAIAGTGIGFQIDLQDEVFRENWYWQNIVKTTVSDKSFLFYAQSFDPVQSPGELWYGFALNQVFIPRRFIIDDGVYFYCCFSATITPDSNPDDFSDEVEWLESLEPDFPNLSIPRSMTLPSFIKHKPDVNEWRKLVNSALNRFNDGLMKKVVLARQSDYLNTGNIAPFDLFNLLRQHNAATSALYYQADPDKAFMSFTPEKLYRRENKKIEIDALSSTAMRGRNDEEDQQRAVELLNNDKQKREHQIVIDTIEKALNRIGENTKTGETGVLSLDHLQHLYTPVTADLRTDIDDRQIIGELHPTPAVGGEDRDSALKYIRTHEPFKRGWYAAPIGLISERYSEIAVAIRSLLLHGNEISVFTGAGIVSGSKADTEWRELNSKNILNCLTGEG